jgi:hypothetical protein
MCFSPEVSLGTGAALLPVGAAITRAAWRKDRRYVPLATTPFIFGIQQLCEGGEWVELDRADRGATLHFALAFLFFALWFWLIWIPLAVAAVEPPGRKRAAFAAVGALGLVLGAAGYGAAVEMGRGEVLVIHHSIRYVFPDRVGGAATAAWGLTYVAAVCAPPILSSDRRLRGFGVALLISAAVSHMIFMYAFSSVWCFFAAALSVYLAYVVRELPPRRASSGVSASRALASPLAHG